MSRPVRRPALLAVAWLATSAAGCLSTPVVKPEAWDGELLAELSADGRLESSVGAEGERVVAPGGAWLAVDPERLTFVRLREGLADDLFAIVLAADAETGALSVLPLEPGETPLDALDDGPREAGLRELVAEHRAEGEPPSGARVVTLSQMLDDKELGPPLPVPRRIVATAANFASHLVVDLGLEPDVIERFRQAPPRVFQKHPPLPAPGSDPRPDLPFRGVIGPFDRIVYPDVVTLPDDEQQVAHVVPTFLDYEVEVGAVLARRLTWDEVQHLSDAELWDCIAGYVLVSDVKARNPQVFERILMRDTVPTEKEKRYLTGDPAVDALIGKWDEGTCAWWGYAASQGDYAALGPFFVEARGKAGLPQSDVVCARSYAAAGERKVPPPEDHLPGLLYLRQCERVGGDASGTGLLWEPPAILRAILSPTGALDLGSEPALERGDIVALGTPGGIALTVKRSRLLGVVQTVLFWWDALDWHDAFFGKDDELYLHQGDRVFLWGRGLGFQLLDVHRFELPPLPAEVPDEDVDAVAEEAQEEVEEQLEEGLPRGR